MPAAEVNRIVEACEADSCAITALSIYLGVPAPDVLRAVTLTDKKHHGKRGLYTHTIKRVAKSLGTELRIRRFDDLDDVYGILLLPDHVVVVRNGLVLECDGTVWDVDHYLSHRNQRAEGVLMAVD